LHFELLRETIVGHTDESTADLDNFTFAKLLCEVKNVLKDVGSISSNLDTAMHNGALSDLNEALDTSRVAKKCQERHLLLIAILKWFFEQW